jgi:hypothetical protein
MTAPAPAQNLQQSEYDTAGRSLSAHWKYHDNSSIAPVNIPIRHGTHSSANWFQCAAKKNTPSKPITKKIAMKVKILRHMLLMTLSFLEVIKRSILSFIVIL